MPFMDGLELCSILTVRLPASKFVVFSGFDDFEYAKQAIQMNVSEYILKPINAPELTAVLERIHGQLDRERTERRDAEQLRQRYEESLPLLRNLFLSRLLDGHVPRERMAELAQRYDVELGGGDLVAALLHVGAADQSELTALLVQQLLEEHLHPAGACAAPSPTTSPWPWWCPWRAGGAVYELIAQLNRSAPWRRATST